MFTFSVVSSTMALLTLRFSQSCCVVLKEVVARCYPGLSNVTISYTRKDFHKTTIGKVVFGKHYGPCDFPVDSRMHFVLSTDRVCLTRSNCPQLSL